MADQSSTSSSNGFFLSLSSPASATIAHGHENHHNHHHHHHHHHPSHTHHSYHNAAGYGSYDQALHIVEEPTSSNTNNNPNYYNNNRKDHSKNGNKYRTNGDDNDNANDNDKDNVRDNDNDNDNDHDNENDNDNDNENENENENENDEDEDDDDDNDMEMDEMIKGEIVSHPLYEKLLSTHLECLSVGLPYECAKELEKQVSNGHVSFAIKYLAQKQGAHQDQAQKQLHHDLKKDIDEFMVTYLQSLTEWRMKMEESIIPQMKKTMHDLLEIENSFCELTGTPCNNISSMIDYHDLTCAESSDDEEYATKLTLMGTSLNLDPCMKPGSSYTTLMDIKQHLGENYRENIFSIRDAILKKRQGSRLQADITILTNWWKENSNWPYPTEEEKRQMASETGLEMRQINNWFINNRKRKWHRDLPKK